MVTPALPGPGPPTGWLLGTRGARGQGLAWSQPPCPQLQSGWGPPGGLRPWSCATAASPSGRWSSRDWPMASATGGSSRSLAPRPSFCSSSTSGEELLPGASHPRSAVLPWGRGVALTFSSWGLQRCAWERSLLGLWGSMWPAGGGLQDPMRPMHPDLQGSAGICPVAPDPGQGRGGETIDPEGGLSQQAEALPRAAEPGTWGRGPCLPANLTPTDHSAGPSHGIFLPAGPREDRPLGECPGSVQTPPAPEGDPDSLLCLVRALGPRPLPKAAATGCPFPGVCQRDVEGQWWPSDWEGLCGNDSVSPRLRYRLLL